MICGRESRRAPGRPGVTAADGRRPGTVRPGRQVPGLIPAASPGGYFIWKPIIGDESLALLSSHEV